MSLVVKYVPVEAREPDDERLRGAEGVAPVRGPDRHAPSAGTVLWSGAPSGL